MKYDCSKTIDFGHEYDRMCKAKDKVCSLCSLDDSFCDTGLITQDDIDIVQAWSDEHTEKTRQDKFLELYPNAAIRLDGISPIKPCWIDNKWVDEIDCETISCADCMRKYWNEVME